MRRTRIILLLGIWVAILPYLGFPIFWKNILFLITGLNIIYLSYILYKENKSEKNEERTYNNFSENRNFVESEPEFIQDIVEDEEIEENK